MRIAGWSREAIGDMAVSTAAMGRWRGVFGSWVKVERGLLGAGSVLVRR